MKIDGGGVLVGRSRLLPLALWRMLEKCNAWEWRDEERTYDVFADDGAQLDALALSLHRESVMFIFSIPQGEADAR